MAARRVDAIKAEASPNKTTIRTVEFRGLTLEVEQDPNEWALEVMEAQEDGNMILCIRGLLGPVQWAQIKSLDLKLKDLGELIDKVLDPSGISLEKSDS